MFVTPSVREAPTTREDVFAFHILKEVASEDMKAMAAYMNDQFDAHDKVSMLLIFDTDEGSEASAGWDWESIKSRARSLTNVERYAVARAPKGAARMIEGMSAILPLEAKAFDDENAAWDYVGARPKSAAA